MRTYFANLSRPKRTATAIQSLFPLVKHAHALELSAQLYGYRDWNELTLITAKGNHAPSPDDDEIPAEDRSRVVDARFKAFSDTFGLSPLADFQFHAYLCTHSKDVPPKRPQAKGFPAGRGRMYKVLQTDLTIPYRIRTDAPADVEPESLTNQERHGHERVPAIFPGGQNAFIDTLCRKASKLQYGNATARELRESFHAADCQPRPTQFELMEGDSESSDGIVQGNTKRLFVFDRDYNPTGILIWSFNAFADRHNDDHNRAEITVHVAWALPRDYETWDSFSEALSNDLCYQVDLMCKGYLFPETENGPRIALSLESESETLFANSHGVLENARDLICDWFDCPPSAVDFAYFE